MLLQLNGKMASYSQIKAAHPDLLLSRTPNEQTMRELGHYVEPTTAPSFDPETQERRQGDPEQHVGGEWHQTWIVRDFTEEELVEQKRAMVPESVPALSGLLALDNADLSAAYESWATDPARTFAERAFINKAMTWRRDDPVIASAAEALELSDDDVDELFIAADKL